MGIYEQDNPNALVIDTTQHSSNVDLLNVIEREIKEKFGTEINFFSDDLLSGPQGWGNEISFKEMIKRLNAGLKHFNFTWKWTDFKGNKTSQGDGLLHIYNKVPLNLNWAKVIKAPSSKHFSFEESTWFDETDVGNMNTEYFKKLVPDQGEAETVYGELLREINNIYYDRYNNGLCNTPHSINTIIKFKDELKENYLEDPSDYDKFIRALARHRNNAYCPDEWEGDGPMESMLYAILLLIRDNV